MTKAKEPYYKYFVLCCIILLVGIFLPERFGIHYLEFSFLCNVQKITSAENLQSRASDEIVPFREFIIKDDTSALL